MYNLIDGDDFFIYPMDIIHTYMIYIMYIVGTLIVCWFHSQILQLTFFLCGIRKLKKKKKNNYKKEEADCINKNNHKFEI
jgi:hypothetical protein